MERTFKILVTGPAKQKLIDHYGINVISFDSNHGRINLQLVDTDFDGVILAYDNDVSLDKDEIIKQTTYSRKQLRAGGKIIILLDTSMGNFHVNNYRIIGQLWGENHVDGYLHSTVMVDNPFQHLVKKLTNVDYLKFELVNNVRNYKIAVVGTNR